MCLSVQKLISRDVTARGFQGVLHGNDELASQKISPGVKERALDPPPPPRPASTLAVGHEVSRAFVWRRGGKRRSGDTNGYVQSSIWNKFYSMPTSATLAVSSISTAVRVLKGKATALASFS